MPPLRTHERVDDIPLFLATGPAPGGAFMLCRITVRRAEQQTTPFFGPGAFELPGPCTRAALKLKDPRNAHRVEIPKKVVLFG